MILVHCVAIKMSGKELRRKFAFGNAIKMGE